MHQKNCKLAGTVFRRQAKLGRSKLFSKMCDTESLQPKVDIFGTVKEQIYWSSVNVG